MVWNPFKIVSKKCLGIDIGSSFVRIVEMSSQRNRIKIENYSEIAINAFSKDSFRVANKGGYVFSDQDMASVVTAISSHAGIKTKQAVFSIPDFSTFFTWFELPSMDSEELSEAIKYEARQHIPFPLSDVAIDWQIIGKSKDKKISRILLVSVPKQIIAQYREIAIHSGLELLAMEAEVFGLSRSLIKNNLPSLNPNKENTVAIVDIGAQSTTVSIIDGGVLKRSHSFDIAGNELTSLLARSFHLDNKKSEEIKHKYGLVRSGEYRDVYKILCPLVDLIVVEIQKICGSFYKTEEKKINKIILAGGGSLLPGLKDYFSESFKKPIEIADPFADLFYPPILEDKFKKMGPLYAVAIGVGLRGVL